MILLKSLIASKHCSGIILLTNVFFCNLSLLYFKCRYSVGASSCVIFIVSHFVLYVFCYYWIIFRKQIKYTLIQIADTDSSINNIHKYITSIHHCTRSLLHFAGNGECTDAVPMQTTIRVHVLSLLVINLGCSCGRVDLEFDYGLNSASQQGEITRLIPTAEEHPICSANYDKYRRYHRLGFYNTL